MEPEGEYFVLDTSFPERTMKIRKDLPIDLRMKFAEVLVEFKGMLTWNSNDLGGIPKEIAEHKLGIHDTSKLIFQKKRIFAKNKMSLKKKFRSYWLQESLRKLIFLNECPI